MITVEDFKEIERLLKLNPEIDPAVEEKQLLTYLLIIVENSIKYAHIVDLSVDMAKKLPFEYIFKFGEISGLHEANEIEEEYSIPGFNNWYKEKFGISVDEAAGGRDHV